MRNVLYFLLFALAACTQSGNAQSNINLSQTEELLKTDKTIQLVDLRTPGEVQRTGVIAGAQVINYNSQDFDQKTGRLDKKKPVLLYCASGGRSSSAMSRLKNMGFVTVYNYTGGMNEWKSKGKPTQ